MTEINPLETTITMKPVEELFYYKVRAIPWQKSIAVAVQMDIGSHSITMPIEDIGRIHKEIVDLLERLADSKWRYEYLPNYPAKLHQSLYDYYKDFADKHYGLETLEK